MDLKFIDHKDPLLKEVKVLWRKNASTLGFFPEDAFHDHARKKWIITATENGKLCGYLLFRVAISTNKISITHLCVAEDYKGKGITTKLLNELVNKFQDLQVRGISLYCREDYKAASKIWERFGFKPLDEKKGKNAEGLQLIYWWYDFGKPDLFTGIYNDDNTKIKAVIDANIIIHLRDPISDYNQEAHTLLLDWVINEADYYFAPEIHNEINRDEDQSRRKETRVSLKRFKELSVQKHECEKIFKDLDSIVSGSSINDTSDKRQLSEAICSGLEYFITRDTNLLNHAGVIIEKFGISVLKPNEFILEIDEINNTNSYQPVRLAGANFDIQKISRAEIKEITNYFHCGGEKEPKKDFEDYIVSLTGDIKNCEIKVVKDKNDIKIALIGKRNCDKNVCEIPIIRIKKEAGKLKNTLFLQLIYDIITEAVTSNQSLIKISEKYLSTEYHSALQSFGFFKKDDHWTKISLKGLIKSEELLTRYPFLSDHYHIKNLIEELNKPNSNDKGTRIKLNIERQLFPLKLSDLDIPTYIIPIKPYWASHLFDTPSANQTLYGANPELAWNRENIYYSKKLTGLTFPARILWYLSSDQKVFRRKMHLVGVSYLDEHEIDAAKFLFKKYWKYGVYRWKDILKLAGHHDKKLIAIKFSDTQLFSNIIPYNDLKGIMYDKNFKTYTFQSSLKISHDIFLKLYKLGMNIE